MKQTIGQISIDDYLSHKFKSIPVNIYGICDDAYCPICDNSLDERYYLDCIQCPHCGCFIDWTPWHNANDEMPIF